MTHPYSFFHNGDVYVYYNRSDGHQEVFTRYAEDTWYSDDAINRIECTDREIYVSAQGARKISIHYGDVIKPSFLDFATDWKAPYPVERMSIP